MIKLSVLDGLVVDRSPISREVSIFKIEPSFTNKLITEKHIHIPQLDKKFWATWEDSFKVELFVNVGVWLVVFVIFTIVVCLLVTKLDNSEWIRVTIIISLSESISRNYKETDEAFAILNKKSLYNLI
jgi:hypothetical protein